MYRANCTVIILLIVSIENRWGGGGAAGRAGSVLARDGITLKHRIGGWGIERGARSDRGRELVLAGDGTGIL